jgi:RsmE family RNA methyltransferase
MNLILLFPEDFIAEDRVCLSGRRLRHLREVHRVEAGGTLRVGLLGGPIGTGSVLRIDDDALELQVALAEPPPPKLPLSLVLALPRPKVLNRVLASAASLGVARIALVNAWKVEKSYWSSPRMDPANLRQQLILGLEQGRDTVLPELRIERLFRPFVEDALPSWTATATALVAHPGAPDPCPRNLDGPCVLAIGPEGGWIESELSSLARVGFSAVDLGPRILRVETAIAGLVCRLF